MRVGMKAKLILVKYVDPFAGRSAHIDTYSLAEAYSVYTNEARTYRMTWLNYVDGLHYILDEYRYNVEEACSG